MSTTTPDSTMRARSDSRNSRRADVQGLRTIAALLVAIYHIWTHRISGAVDIFFVVSAFVMTLSLLRGLDADRSVHLLRYYRSLFVRMVPTMLVVIVGTLIAALALLPMSDWTALGQDARAAAGLFINWHFAIESVSYLGAEASSSPFQHLWAMAVQVQLQVVLPLVAVLAVAVGRVLGWSARPVMAIALMIIAIASFVYALRQNAVQPDFAYFDTAARGWEFALGALSAYAVQRWRPSRWLATAMVGLGAATLVAMGALLDLQAGSPGMATLVPVGAALLVIVGGARSNVVSSVISAKPFARLAEYSFSFYLWHWPVLVITRSLTGADEMGPLLGALVLAVSAVLAWLTTTFVEGPIRRSARDGRSLRRRLAPFVASAAAAAILVGAVTTSRAQVEQVIANTPSDNPGAAVLVDDTVRLSPLAGLQPALEALPDGEWQSWMQSCEMLEGPSGHEFRRCSAGAEDAPMTVLAQGDSHTEVWLSALAPAIADGRARVVSDFIGSCPLSKGASDKMSAEDPRWVGCVALNDDRIALIEEVAPDVVITTGNVSLNGAPDIIFTDGFVEQVEQIASLGYPVVVLRDTPRRDQDTGPCLLAANREQDCDVPSSAILADDDFEASLPVPLYESDLVQPLDMTDFLCFAGNCPVAIGGVITYFDSNHLTRSYVSTLAPYFLERFAAALDRIPTPVSLAL